MMRDLLCEAIQPMINPGTKTSAALAVEVRLKEESKKTSELPQRVTVFTAFFQFPVQPESEQ